jgi:acyl-CoA hydrolase
MSRKSSCTADEAARLVRPVDRIAMPLGPGQPPAFLAALGRRTDWQDLTLFTALLTGLYPLFAQKGVHLRSGFFGPAERALRAAGHDVAFVPGDFRRFEKIAQQLEPRIVAIAAAPPDAHGRVSFSLHAGASVEAIRAAARDPDRLLVVETSPAFPRTAGLPPEHPHSIALDEIDVWIESDSRPFELPDVPPGPEEVAIAQHVLPFVDPEATLQVGIGGIPNAIVAAAPTASTPRCSRPASCSSIRRAACAIARAASTATRSRPSRWARAPSTTGSTATRPCASCPSRSSTIRP